jgi:PD-(D/E)XK nuclease superfamily/Domain of unknown function (DUF2357)
MVSSPTSRLRYLSESGEPIEAPGEWMKGFVEILCEAEQLESVRLVRNGVDLNVVSRKIGEHRRIVAEWPLSGAGNYELKLTTGFEGEQERLVCTVPSRKLAAASVEQMVTDLQERLPASIAIALQRAGALAGIDLLPPDESTLAAELHRIRRAIDGTPSRAGLVRVLQRLRERPYQVLRSHETWTERERARRVDPTRLVQAFSYAGNLDEHHLPIRVPERRVEHSVDIYENRLLKAFHDQVNAKARRVLEALRRRKSGALAAEAAELIERLAFARRSARFLDEVTALAESPSRVTMVLTKRPEYREALEGLLEFRRRALIQLREAALDAPLENLPELYQGWGTLIVIDELLSVAAEHGYDIRQQRLAHPTEGGLWIEVLRDGSPAVVLVHPESERVVRLIPQRTYSRKYSGTHSVSFNQIPDVAVEVVDGPATRIYIFDPKYKLQSEQQEGQEAKVRPKKVDIDAMHSYRDAIRDEDGNHIVRFAAILYPGPTDLFEDGLAAIHAEPGDVDSPQRSIGEVLSVAIGSIRNDRLR